MEENRNSGCLKKRKGKDNKLTFGCILLLVHFIYLFANLVYTIPKQKQLNI